jgi:hypothetical protein
MYPTQAGVSDIGIIGRTKHGWRRGDAARPSAINVRGRMEMSAMQSEHNSPSGGWTVPTLAAPDEPFVADERAMIEGFLERYRVSLLSTCAGLTAQQLVLQAVPPSNLTLLGLIRHVTDVERTWFRRRFLGKSLEPLYSRPERPGAAFEEVDPRQAPAAIDTLLREWVSCRDELRGASLDDTFQSERWGEMSLRWIYLHMIGEYAQHNGHADLLRERIDGKTGL